MREGHHWHSEEEPEVRETRELSATAKVNSAQERVEEPGNGVKEDLGTIEVVLSKGAASVGGISLPRTSAAAQSTIDERAKQVSS